MQASDDKGLRGTERHDDGEVTLAAEAGTVCTDPPRTGICVIRVESRNRQLLVTLRTNPDIERVSVEQVHHTVDLESTIIAIREFLSAFIASSQQRPPP